MAEMTTTEKIALASSGVIIAGAVIYWIVQIIGVIEFLQLAYG